MLTTPGIRMLGATPIESVGSTIPAILPGALSGAWRYSRAHMVDWSIALPSGVLGAGFAVVGAEASDHVNGHYLMLLTAAMLLWNGLTNVRARARVPEKVAVPVGGPADAEGVELHEHVHAVGHGRSKKPSRVSVAAIGAVAGMLAGLLGVGGGVLLVPAYTGLLRMPAKRAVATSLVAVAIFSVPAMITHTLLGHINWAYALPLVVGVVPGRAGRCEGDDPRLGDPAPVPHGTVLHRARAGLRRGRADVALTLPLPPPSLWPAPVPPAGAGAPAAELRVAVAPIGATAHRRSSARGGGLS